MSWLKRRVHPAGASSIGDHRHCPSQRAPAGFFGWRAAHRAFSEALLSRSDWIAALRAILARLSIRTAINRALLGPTLTSKVTLADDYYSHMA